MTTGPYSTTLPMVRGKTCRFWLLDVCGNPVPTRGTYTTDGYMQVQSTKNYDNGDEIKVRQANGYIGVHEVGRQTFLNFTLKIDLIKVNPGVLTMLTGDTAVLDWQSTIVGWEELELQPLTSNFAFEVWTGTSGLRCTSGSLLSGFMLYPLLSQVTLDVDDVTDKEVTLHINAMSGGNPQWGKGPYGGLVTGVPGPVAADALNTPSRLLLPVNGAAHRHFEVTPIPAPAPSPADGPQTYVLPTPY